MSRAEMECLVIPSVLGGLAIGVWLIVFVQAIWRMFRPAAPPEPGDFDYEPDESE